MSGFEYQYRDGEANFGPPLEKEVSGGAHIVFDIVPVYNGEITALRLPDGLHGDRKNALYFPHGLIRFGEETLECVSRVCQEFVGVRAVSYTPISLSSWVDENNHWHLCFNVIAELEKAPIQKDFVSELVSITKASQADEFPWWDEALLEKVIRMVNRT